MAKQYLLPAILLFFHLFSAAAAESYGPTDNETKLLPPYCGGPGGGDWKAILGPEIVWINHSCYGINRINRYYNSRRAQEKQFHLRTALDDLNYSVGHLKPDFKLMPEIYYYRGLTYSLLKNDAKAISDYFKSVSLDPKYTKSISAIAGIYERTPANRGKALELVTEGLRHNPESKALKRRFSRLGGQLPYPVPYVKTGDQGASANLKNSQNEQTDSSGITINVTKQEAVPVHVKTAEESPGVVEPLSAEKPAESETKPPQPLQGTPSNPWCRFCPDAGSSLDPGSSKQQVDPKVLK